MSHPTLTKAKLEKYVKVRNKADFHSNMQFQIDAEECGFSMADLGPAKKEGYDYTWATPFGTLREHRGLLSLE